MKFSHDGSDAESIDEEVDQKHDDVAQHVEHEDAHGTWSLFAPTLEKDPSSDYIGSKISKREVDDKDLDIQLCHVISK